jgi:NAD(P)H-hydrate repair Nnr-like enzyme with NAD(P)H-hydrate epimerase domain
MLTSPMNLFDLTITQLKRAAAIKEQIEALNKELRAILSAPAPSGAAPKTSGAMSAAVKKKIAATQKARWANLRRAKAAALPVKPAATAKKNTMSPAERAKRSAKLKAFWAAKKAGKK